MPDSTIDFKLDGIGRILTDRRLAVPIYQRSYAWEDDQVTDFWNDLLSAFRSDPQEYFLGTVVLSREGNTDRDTIIDGQQRLATTTIAMAALRDLHTARGEHRRGSNLHDRYIGDYDDARDEDVPRLRLNADDDTYFEQRIVKGQVAVEATRKSHKLILDAYNTLREAVNELADTHGDDWPTKLAEFRQFLEESARVVSVRVPSESDAFMIFETLNARGKELTLADLLKNYLFGLAGTTKLTHVRDAWMLAQAALDMNSELFITFLRHFWSFETRAHPRTRTLQEHQGQRCHGISVSCIRTGARKRCQDLCRAAQQ